MLIVLIKLIETTQRDPCRCQQTPQVSPYPLLVPQKKHAALTHGGKLESGGQTIGRKGNQTFPHLPHKTGDAHGIELVQIARAYREEAKPFQQRIIGVLRLVHDALIERKP
ncbi:hypothetical protein AA0472_2231 [Acetobacter estunensis NRIC 0472]|nr:hypothetical protein AA0472_2231 [Acetobacter estunensis NRIC 0472]